MRIIYKRPEPDGRVVVMSASPEWGGTMEELAQKDVPRGLKYKIVEDSVILIDRTFRGAWEVDEAELTDGVGADYGVQK